MIPGEIQTAAGDIELNIGQRTVKVSVANSGDRPRVCKNACQNDAFCL